MTEKSSKQTLWIEFNLWRWFGLISFYVRSHIGWRGERSILNKGVETSPTCFKNLHGKFERESPKGKYLLVVGLGYYKWYRARHWAVCQRGRWAPKGEWIVRSHTDWRGKWVSARTLSPEGDWIVRDLTSVGEENEAFFITMWKPLPNMRVLKTLWGWTVTFLGLVYTLMSLHIRNFLLHWSLNFIIVFR